MRRLSRFRHPSWPGRRLLLEAAGQLAWTRLGLWLWPVETLRCYPGFHLYHPAAMRPVAGQDASMAVSETAVAPVLLAVQTASHYIPGATCLSQALTAYTLLRRRGYLCQVRIGVAKDARGRLVAHAWVEREGRILLGQRADLATYAVLSALERAA